METSYRLGTPQSLLNYAALRIIMQVSVILFSPLLLLTALYRTTKAVRGI